MRVPWLVVGLLAGIVGVCLVLPCCSDSTGGNQTVVIIGGLVGGLLLGVVLDSAHPRHKP
jgi:uncharacterized membrane protein YeaQ/YmgE (transglycosylase-associated protein family)